MLQRYAQTVLEILTARGSFDTDPATLVNHAIEALSGLVLADQIATASDSDRWLRPPDRLNPEELTAWQRSPR